MFVNGVGLLLLVLLVKRYGRGYINTGGSVLILTCHMCGVTTSLYQISTTNYMMTYSYGNAFVITGPL